MSAGAPLCLWHRQNILNIHVVLAAQPSGSCASSISTEGAARVGMKGWGGPWCEAPSGEPGWDISCSSQEVLFMSSPLAKLHAAWTSSHLGGVKVPHLHSRPVVQTCREMNYLFAEMQLSPVRSFCKFSCLPSPAGCWLFQSVNAQKHKQAKSTKNNKNPIKSINLSVQGFSC